MIICLCGSMSFAQDMLNLRERLEDLGHTCLVPEGLDDYDLGRALGSSEKVARKRALGAPRKHRDKIRKSDAVLVVNGARNGVDGYIGGHTFLEIGYAYLEGKQIYALRAIDCPAEMAEEIELMAPVVLGERLERIAA